MSHLGEPACEDVLRHARGAYGMQGPSQQEKRSRKLERNSAATRDWLGFRAGFLLMMLTGDFGQIPCKTTD